MPLEEARRSVGEIIYNVRDSLPEKLAELREDSTKWAIFRISVVGVCFLIAVGIFAAVSQRQKCFTDTCKKPLVCRETYLSHVCVKSCPANHDGRFMVTDKSCQKYYQCVKGVRSSTMSCQKGFFYDVARHTCTVAKPAGCQVQVLSSKSASTDNKL